LLNEILRDEVVDSQLAKLIMQDGEPAAKSRLTPEMQKAGDHRAHHRHCQKRPLVKARSQFALKSVGPQFLLLDISGKNGWTPKHFWTFVWNFETKMVEILEITQTTIQTALEELINSEGWGSLFGYMHHCKPQR